MDELHYIQANVETMLRQREQYVQQISKKDAALSGFLLQSQLKNIYVELDVPDQISSAEDLVFYILYFRIHYRNGALDTITAEPPAVSHMLLENLRQTLSLLFGTALIFQLEPNQFVAKVSLPAARQDISDQMQYLLQRLDNEREFAFLLWSKAARWVRTAILPPSMTRCWTRRNTLLWKTAPSFCTCRWGWML